MIHTQALDCPCEPVTVEALGGGSVQVHREQSQQGERKPQALTCPNCGTAMPVGVQDPFCFTCGKWHARDQHGAPATSLLRQIEDDIRALPRRNFGNHTGDWIERAAVLSALNPRKREKAA